MAHITRGHPFLPLDSRRKPPAPPQDHGKGGTSPAGEGPGSRRGEPQGMLPGDTASTRRGKNLTSASFDLTQGKGLGRFFQLEAEGQQVVPAALVLPD